MRPLRVADVVPTPLTGSVTGSAAGQYGGGIWQGGTTDRWDSSVLALTQSAGADPAVDARTPVEISAAVAAAIQIRILDHSFPWMRRPNHNGRRAAIFLGS